MHIKIAGADSWNLGDTSAALVKRSSRGIIGEDFNCLVKRAGEEFAHAVKDVKMAADEIPVHVIALGDHERYGCFFAGAPVHTLSGIKAIEDVAVGEAVLTHRNRYRRVLERFEADYSGVSAAIGCRGLPDPIVSTVAHPHCVIPQQLFTTRIRYEQRQAGTYADCIDSLVEQAGYVDASDILPGDFLVVPCCPESPEEIDLPDSADPYVLGVYVSEGCLYRKGVGEAYSGLVFVLGDHDAALVEYLQRWHCTKPQPSLTSEFSIRYSVGDKPLAAVVDRLFGHTSHTKHIHPSVFAWSEADRLKFLAGYFDGDGCVCTATADSRSRYVGTLRASTVSRTLALDIQRLCASVGVSASVSRCHNYEKHRGKFEGFGKGRGDLPIFHINVGARDSDRILQRCLRLQPHGRNIKYGGSSVFTSGKYMLLSVRTVELAQIEDAVRYNLAVEEDNTYVVDIWTHNSNRNGDCFKSAALTRYHPTFVKHARAYRHHVNKDPKKSYGTVKASAFNKEMGRVELLIGYNSTKEAAERNGGLVADKELEKLAKKQDLAVSMACVSNPDYPVLTRDRGWVCIYDIAVGDFVWTHNARWRRVHTLTRRQYSGELFTFHVDGSSLPLELTAEHPMWAMRCGIEDWYPASVLKDGDLFFSCHTQPPAVSHSTYCIQDATSCRYAYRVSKVTSRFATDVPVYNFEVEEDESYSLGGFISHNCKVSYDVCLACGNKARTRAEYCTEDTCKYGGCKDNLTKVAEDGFVLGVDNPHPAFFDISSVYRPADRIAYGNVADYLQKSASDGRVIGGSELGEMYSASPPLDLLLDDVFDLRTISQVKLAYELAALEDTIEREKPQWAQDIARAFSNTFTNRNPIAFSKTAVYRPVAVLNTLWHSRDILLPPHDFVSLALGSGSEKNAAVTDSVIDLLPGIYNRLIVSDDLVGQIRDHAKFAQQNSTAASLCKLAEKNAESRSVDPAFLQKRIWQSALHNLPVPSLSQRRFDKQAETGLASELARRYALYKLACLQKYAGTDRLPLTCKAAIVQNYVS